MRLTIPKGHPRSRGQAVVEFAFVFPIFMLLLFAIIIVGLYVFYNQQLANAASQAARYATTHSTTALCPTVSRLDSPPSLATPNTTGRCDAPEQGWPKMTAAARSSIWAMDPNQVTVVACWSGYVDTNANYDALPTDPNNTFTDCTMRETPGSLSPINPKTNEGGLPCPAVTVGSAVNPPKADGDDKASAIAVAVGNNTPYPTTVTVYTCFKWTPPLAGLIFMPSQITLRAVVTQALQRQQ